MKSQKIESEIVLTSVCTIIFTTILYFTEFYGHFLEVEGDIKQLILYSLSFLITLIGVILAVHTLLVTLFNKSVVENIKEESIKIILDSFVTLMKIIIFDILWLLILYFVILSKKEIIKVCMFYLIFIITFWLFFYIIFIIVELVKNINKLFNVKNDCEKIEEIRGRIEKQEKDFLFLIQEYLLKKTVENNLINETQLKNELYKLIDEYSINQEEKEQLVEYVNNYYNWK